MNTEEKIKFLAEFLICHYADGQVHPDMVKKLEEMAELKKLKPTEKVNNMTTDEEEMKKAEEYAKNIIEKIRQIPEVIDVMRYDTSDIFEGEIFDIRIQVKKIDVMK